MDRIHKIRAVQEHYQLNIKIHSIKTTLPSSASLQVVVKRGKRNKKSSPMVECDNFTGVTFFDCDLHFAVTMFKRFDRFLEKKVSFRVVMFVGDKAVKDGKAIVNISSLVKNKRSIELQDFQLFGGWDKKALICMSITIVPTNSENPHHIVKKEKRGSFITTGRLFGKSRIEAKKSLAFRDISSDSDEETNILLDPKKNFMRRTSIGVESTGNLMESPTHSGSRSNSKRVIAIKSSVRNFIDRCPQSSLTAKRTSIAVSSTSSSGKNADFAKIFSEAFREKPHKNPENSVGELGSILHPPKVEVPHIETHPHTLKASMAYKHSNAGVNYNSSFLRSTRNGEGDMVDRYQGTTRESISCPISNMHDARPNSMTEGFNIQDREGESQVGYVTKVCDKCVIF